MRRRARRDSCRIRWSGFRFIRRKRRRGSRRERLLRVLVEGLFVACNTKSQEAHGTALKPHHSYSATERSSNGGTIRLSRLQGQARTEARSRIESDRGKIRRELFCRLDVGDYYLKTQVSTRKIGVGPWWRRSEDKVAQSGSQSSPVAAAVSQSHAHETHYQSPRI